MARKKHFDYFGELNRLAANAYESAKILEMIMMDYSLEKLVAESEKIHTLEKDSDEIGRNIVSELYVSFITPIDREDIVHMTDCLDNVIDNINSLTFSMDHLLVTEVTEVSKQMVAYVVAGTAGLVSAMQEFAKFKNSKTLNSMIYEVNNIESQADRLYSDSVKALFTSEKDVLKIIKWKEVYDQLEATINACETAANLIVGIVIKNS
ncbi:DUF47 domain-containing protein [Enterococcus faecalis]